MSAARAEEDETLVKADFPVLRTTPLRWADIDTYGHVNNAVHYLLVDTAINGWLMEATGGDIRQLSAIGVVVETGCRYQREIHFPCTPVLGLRLGRLGTSSVQYEVAIFIDEGAPAATARFVHVYIDPTTRRPVSVPDEIREALAELDPSVGTSATSTKTEDASWGR